MAFFDLHAMDGGAPSELETFEADDLVEAVALSVLRLERRDVELRVSGVCVARIPKNGSMAEVEKCRRNDAQTVHDRLSFEAATEKERETEAQADYNTRQRQSATLRWVARQIVESVS